MVETRKEKTSVQHGLQSCKGTGSALLLYTLGFVVAAGALLYPFVREGRFFIHGSDGYSQHYAVFQYLGEYYRQVFSQILQGDFLIPMFDFSIGFGEDILTTLNYYGLGDPFYLLAAVTPAAWMPHMFTAILVMRFYLAGMAFYGFSRQLEHGHLAGITGGWLYAFSTLLYASIHQTVFSHAILLLPLLLWGAVRIMQGKSPLMLALFTFVSGLCGFYFLVLSSFALAVTVLAYSIPRHPEDRLKGLIGDIFRCVAAYLSGLLMSMVILWPELLTFFGSNRNEKDVRGLLASWSEIKSAFVNLCATGGSVGMGSLILLGAAILLFAGWEHLNRKCMLLAAVLPILSPFVSSAMVAFTRYQSPNWWYLVAFAFAYATVCALPMVGQLTRLQRTACIAVSVLYAAAQYKVTDSGRMVLICLSLSLVIVLLFSEKRRFSLLRDRRIGAVLLSLVAIINIAAGNWMWAESNFESYRTSRFAALEAPVTGDQLTEPWLYRVDTTDVSLARWWSTSNAPMHGNYNGLSAYFSILNPNVLQAIDDWGLNAARNRSFYYRGVDLCVGLQTMSSVKYLFVRGDEHGYVPYGYNYVGETHQSTQFTHVPDNGEMLYRYENLYQLPLGYTYNQWMTAQEYQALDGYDKQAAMLQAVVLEKPAVYGTQVSPDLSGLEWLKYHVVGLVDCAQTSNGGYLYTPGESWLEEGVPENWPKPSDGKGLVLMEVEVPANTEVHIYMPDLWQDNGYFRWCSVTADGRTKDFWVTDPEGIESGGIGEEAWVNLGYFPEACTVMVGLECPEGDGQPVHFGEVAFKAWDMADYAAHASARAETVLQNIVVDTNSVAGLLQTEKDTLLFLSIPYSEGWHATVDGVPAVPQKANSMFMALEVPAGEHVIGLYYITPGLKAGCMLTALGGVTLLAQLGWYYHKKLRQKKEAAVCT